METESTNTAAVTVAIGPEFDECPVSEVLRVAMGHAHEVSAVYTVPITIFCHLLYKLRNSVCVRYIIC